MKNKNQLLKIVFSSLAFVLFSLQIKAQTHAYLEQYKPLAQRLSTQYEIPACLILAIAFVESGGGSSQHLNRLNNHFGITGKNNTHSKYKQFSCVEKSYTEFCELISSKSYYNLLKKEKDLSKWINAIAPTYSSHPSTWKKKIYLVIEKYKLADLPS